MNNDYIVIKGARENNLKNINLKVPRNKLVVMTGVSGSGKTSLAFDTIYAEGQRRYVESLSAYARMFLDNVDKPDVDLIEGLSPAISIDQKTTSRNPRSTVGTVTEIYDYLRLLFARIGVPYCPEHHIPIESQSIEEMVNKTFESIRKNYNTDVFKFRDLYYKTDYKYFNENCTNWYEEIFPNSRDGIVKYLSSPSVEVALISFCKFIC